MVEAAPRFRLGWWWLPIIALLLLGLTAIILALWLRSTGDLEAEMARAQAAGVPISWEELGLPVSAPGDQRRIARFEALSRRAKRDGPDGTIQEPPSPFDPPSEVLRAWDSGIDTELDALIGELGGEPCWSVDHLAIRQGIDRRNARKVVEAIVPGGWDQRSEIRDLLLLRSARGKDDPARLSQLILRLTCTQPSAGLVGTQYSNQFAAAWIKHVLRNRNALDAAETARTALALAERLDRNMRLAVRVEVVAAVSYFQLPIEDLLRAWNMRLPAAMVYDLPRRICFRAGRRPILARYVAAADWISRHGLPTSLSEVAAACPAPEEPNWSNLHRTMLSLTLEGSSCGCMHGPRQTWMHNALLGHIRTTLHLRLLAADLVGDPWPNDPQDPAGGRLHPIVRDGAVIGGYSLGSDGVDGGGSQQQDWCWPLRAQLGSPKASDPVKPP